MGLPFGLLIMEVETDSMQAVCEQGVTSILSFKVIPCLSLHSFLKQVSVPKAFFGGK